MTPQQKANWIRRLFTVAMVAAAAAAGLFLALPDGWWKRFTGSAEEKGLQVTKENIAEIQASPDKLTVTNMMVDGNPDSRKLKEILEKLKKDKYGDKVVLAELDVTREPELAASQGVEPDEEFAGHLDFHANGRKLAELVNQTDPVVVEKTIDRLLAGLVQRIDKNWLPEVPGMQRDEGQEILEIKPASHSK